VDAEAKYSPWFQALVVAPPVICGRALLPYSIGHELILSELGNVYVRGGGDNRYDLLMALQICSRTVTAFRDWRAAGLPGWRGYCWRWRRADLATAESSFRAYLDNYNRLPALVSKGNVRKLDASPYWHMARILCEHYGATLADVWDTPKPVAICAVDCRAESQGTASEACDEEEAVLQLVQRAQALIDAGDNEGAQRLFAQAEIAARGMRGAQ